MPVPYLFREFVPRYSAYAADYFSNKRDGPIPEFKDFIKNRSYDHAADKALYKNNTANINRLLTLLDAMDNPDEYKLPTGIVCNLLQVKTNVNIMEHIKMASLEENVHYVKMPGFQNKYMLARYVSHAVQPSFLGQTHINLTEVVFEDNMIKEDIIFSYNGMKKIMQYIHDRPLLNLLAANLQFLNIEDIYTKIKKVDEFNRISYLNAKSNIGLSKKSSKMELIERPNSDKGSSYKRSKSDDVYTKNHIEHKLIIKSCEEIKSSVESILDALDS